MGKWDETRRAELRTAVQQLARRAGYHVGRLPANRFDAMDDALAGLARRGFRPRVIIDAGAHVGNWTRLARATFPDAEYHLIEPQPACQAALAALAAAGGRIQIHPVALTRPGVSDVPLISDGETGAWVPLGDPPSGEAAVRVPASTLDRLVGDRVTRDARPLLKMDVEGHELELLTGAAAILRDIEVMIAEVAFFDVEGAGHPVVADVLAFVRDRGFELLDIVALGSRRRDGRLRSGDVMFARRDSDLLADVRWA
jgi:FkbM family methyltransferase